MISSSMTRYISPCLNFVLVLSKYRQVRLQEHNTKLIRGRIITAHDAVNGAPEVARNAQGALRHCLRATGRIRNKMPPEAVLRAAFMFVSLFADHVPANILPQY